MEPARPRAGLPDRAARGRAGSIYKLVERSIPNQLAAVFAAPGTDIDQVISRANDLFLVLDHEQRIAFVAQVMHHTHEPANIARMQTDARFVHDEQCVDQRCTETCGEVHPLHFAAAQSARGSIEREIANADFAKIIEARANFVA